MTFNDLFHNEQKENTSSRMLNGTAELNRISSGIANDILRRMEEDIETYRPRIAKSAVDSREMDALLDEFRPWTDIEEDDPIRHLDDETVESMLKSQQSKRSRTKSKTMTLDNYAALMTATIAEALLREIYNKPKSASYGARRSGVIDYTPAQLEEYANDQDLLRKEIRNIQSKKSIAKSKADFDEASEYYQALLKAERMLKDLRVSTSEVDRTKSALKDLIGDVDITQLKAADSAELLAKIKTMISSDEGADA